MRQHLETMARVLEHGELCPDRTGIGRLSIFGPGTQETYDLTGNVVPMLTTRKLYYSFLNELFGMIKGSDKVTDLGESFWGEWSPTLEYVKDNFRKLYSTEEGKKELSTLNVGDFEDFISKLAERETRIGTIGPMYGKMWREWPLVNQDADFSWIKSFEDIASDKREFFNGEFDKLKFLHHGELKDDEETRKSFIGDSYLRSLDQMQRVMVQLKRNPHSTHHRITAFNPALIGPHADPRQNVLDGFGALSPCHTFFQFHVRDNTKGDPKLDCHLYMGSSDVCLGRPYNVTFYSVLTIMMSHCLGYKAGNFTLTSGNTHIYGNHIEQAKEHVKLKPLENKTVLTINPDVTDLFKLKKEDLSFSEYLHLDPIRYKANV